MFKDLNERKRAECCQLDNPDGQELYDILLGNIEQLGFELETMKIEKYIRRMKDDYQTKNL